jgi:hypothetical protein
VEAELRLDRLGHLADLGGEGGLEERRVELRLAGDAVQAAALGGGDGVVVGV